MLANRIMRSRPGAVPGRSKRGVLEGNGNEHHGDGGRDGQGRFEADSGAGRSHNEARPDDDHDHHDPSEDVGRGYYGAEVEGGQDFARAHDAGAVIARNSSLLDDLRSARDLAVADAEHPHLQQQRQVLQHQQQAHAREDHGQHGRRRPVTIASRDEHSDALPVRAVGHGADTSDESSDGGRKPSTAAGTNAYNCSFVLLSAACKCKTVSSFFFSHSAFSSVMPIGDCVLEVWLVDFTCSLIFSSHLPPPSLISMFALMPGVSHVLRSILHVLR